MTSATISALKCGFFPKDSIFFSIHIQYKLYNLAVNVTYQIGIALAQHEVGCFNVRVNILMVMDVLQDIQLNKKEMRSLKIYTKERLRLLQLTLNSTKLTF